MREARAPILIVTGPSGVGKSTVSRLVAATLDAKTTHVRIDDFTRFIVNGWVEPWLPESSHQNEVIGGAVGSDVQGMHDTRFVCPELTVQRIGWLRVIAAVHTSTGCGQ